jgi:NTP pyrophosphatase (non-canonical NTP hydrolase)
MTLTLRQLQEEQKKWVQHNFPGFLDYYPLLGAVEELGELAHAHLKMVQGIRGTREEHLEKAQDAIGDVIIYLSNYCTAMGFDFQKILETTWDEVKQRDWKRFPKDGVSE